MAGRAFAFSDPDIIRLAQEAFIPVAADDWYQRRRQDDEGRFFIKVANQGPRKGRGGSTRQGIYCLTASGKLLAYRNAGNHPGVMKSVMEQALAKWKELPDSETAPNQVSVPDHGTYDPRYHRIPPDKGLILRVHARALDLNVSGLFSDATCRKGSGDEASRDHLWLTQAEWRSLIPGNPKPGQSHPLPRAIAERVARFHLIDNTRGEPPMWRRDQIRNLEMTLTVEKATQDRVDLRLEGKALLATDEDPTQAKRGFDASVLGYLSYDRQTRAMTRFDAVATGEHWGSGTFTRRDERPGRTPLGVAFILVPKPGGPDRIPPQAARNLGEYFGR